MLLICVILKICCWPQSTGKLFEFSAYIISKILHIKRFWFSWKIVIFRLTVFWLWGAEGLALKLAGWQRGRGLTSTLDRQHAAVCLVFHDKSDPQTSDFGEIPFPFPSVPSLLLSLLYFLVFWCTLGINVHSFDCLVTKFPVFIVH